MTLEELKKLSPDQLYARWSWSLFPFDKAGCGDCLTFHATPPLTCFLPAHKDLKSQVPKPKLQFFSFTKPKATWLVKHLDELYALRLFFKDLYLYTPQVEEPQPVEEMVEAT